MTEKKRVLVGCPTHKTKEYCLKAFAEAVNKLKTDETFTYDVLLVDNTAGDQYLEKIRQHGLNVIKGPWRTTARERIMASRNVLRKITLEQGYDYFFSLEQDVVPQPGTLLRMMQHVSKRPTAIKILTSVVYNTQPYGKESRWLPMLYVQHPVDEEGLWYVSEESLQKEELKGVVATHLACTLVHRDVLDLIEFRLIGTTNDYMAFSKDANEYGVRIVVDTSIRPEHAREKR